MSGIINILSGVVTIRQGRIRRAPAHDVAPLLVLVSGVPYFSFLFAGGQRDTSASVHNVESSSASHMRRWTRFA